VNSGDVNVISNIIKAYEKWVVSSTLTVRKIMNNFCTIVVFYLYKYKDEGGTLWEQGGEVFVVHNRLVVV